MEIKVEGINIRSTKVQYPSSQGNEGESKPIKLIKACEIHDHSTNSQMKFFDYFLKKQIDLVFLNSPPFR